MQNDITIPDEVVEPIARALCVAEGCDPELLRFNGNDKLWTAWIDEARAAILTALQAWPGSSYLCENDSATIRDLECFILPLPTKETDA